MSRPIGSKWITRKMFVAIGALCMTSHNLRESRLDGIIREKKYATRTRIDDDWSLFAPTLKNRKWIAQIVGIIRQKRFWRCNRLHA